VAETMTSLSDLEPKAQAGDAFTRAEVERVLACPDLVAVGMLGEAARRARRGDRITYGRVAIVTGGVLPEERGEAGEVRLVGTPESADQARAWTRAVATWAAGVPFTAFSLADLLELAGGDHLGLAALARALSHDGLDAVAEFPLDRLGDTENVIEVVRAINHGGLGVWRATIDRATLEERLDLIERAAAVQHETGALRAFAPLPRQDPAGTPSTGYDDVRTVTAARLMCASIPSIQVDWPLYGPKLAQVALAYGADDVDGVAVVDTLKQGHRRSPREDIERQIRAAAATPAERDGRYELRS
jgi:hypothetical protein